MSRLETGTTTTPEETRLAAVFARLREPVVATTAAGRIVAVNPAAQRLFQDPSTLIRGAPIDRLLPFLEGQAGDVGEERTWHGALTDAAGTRVDLDVTRTVLPPGHTPATHLYFLHDISPHAEVSRRREQLLYSVAHELRGPLAVLEAVLEILSTEPACLSAEEVTRLLTTACRATRRQRTLVENLLSAGSIQAGRFAVRPQATPVTTLVDAALTDVEPNVEARRQHIERELSAGEVLVLADPYVAPQVLVNLLTNASKYSPHGAGIQLSAVQAETLVRFEVHDHGPGIPSERQAGLFDRFYRVQPRGEQPGVGLGLAITKGIVEAHGGTIGVESALGRGTSVWFTLPCAGAPA